MRTERNRIEEEKQEIKNRRKRGAAIAALIVALLIGGGIFGGRWFMNNMMHTDAYAAGRSNTVPVWKMDTEEGEKESADGLKKAGRLTRGTLLKKYRRSFKKDGVTYVRTETEGDEELYVRAGNLSDTLEGCVKETEVYVRTPATIYKNAEGPEIASFAPKGTCLKVTGHDKLLDNGYINKYKVEYTKGKKTREGFVYGKYMAGTEKAALKHYNKHGEYDKAKGDNFRFELYGGKAANLDFFPYEKTKIKGNKFCRYARAMYINTEAAVHPKEYVKLIKETDCNAVVIDIKDGPLTYESPVAKKISPYSYDRAYATMDEMKAGVQAYKDTGVYLIGRIVVFNDKRYAVDHPEDCIKYKGSTSWPSGYSRDVWEYNVKLAQEAVREFGFNEIQFDYVRFPESSYDMSSSGKAKFRNKYDEEKGQAIQNFCFYAADQLREVGAYMSIDVFGESAYSYMTAYGQYWAGIANIADAISAMPYTDHFSADRAWERPYDSMYNWAKFAAEQQDMIKDPAAARTWITGYDTPYWAPSVNYNAKRLKAQIKAIEDAGLDGGFIPWNVFSDLGKYNQYKSIWNE